MGFTNRRAGSLSGRCGASSHPLLPARRASRRSYFMSSVRLVSQPCSAFLMPINVPRGLPGELSCQQLDFDCDFAEGKQGLPPFSGLWTFTVCPLTNGG